MGSVSILIDVVLPCLGPGFDKSNICRDNKRLVLLRSAGDLSKAIYSFDTGQL